VPFFRRRLGERCASARSGRDVVDRRRRVAARAGPGRYGPRTDRARVDFSNRPGRAERSVSPSSCEGIRPLDVLLPSVDRSLTADRGSDAAMAVFHPAGDQHLRCARRCEWWATSVAVRIRAGRISSRWEQKSFERDGPRAEAAPSAGSVLRAPSFGIAI
jgi:hypothetical protein